MNNKMFCLVFIILLFTFQLTAANDFYAYHTKVAHSATDYMGRYADIIVVLGGGKQLEFTRRTGYLPKLTTSLGEFMVDDLFPGRDPDFEFNYNYVRLLENTPEKIVVEWRYFADSKILDEANRDLEPLILHGFLGVIYEIYTITPDGTVQRKVQEAKNTRNYDWNVPGSATIQTLKLTDAGIEHGAVQWGRSGSPEQPTVTGAPVKEVEGLPDPVHHWPFDEGLEDFENFVMDEAGESEYSIEGIMTVFKKGVSGTSLAFDGYYSGVTFSWADEESPAITDAMSLEAWIALDVYPYNNVPVIHQSRGFGEKGYYFGVDAHGHLFLTFNGQTVKTSDILPLYRWTHVAATVGGGKMNLYIDGVQKASAAFTGSMAIPDAPVTIGLNTEKERCTDFVRTNDQNLLFIYGIQGLLDEIKMYDVKLDRAQLEKAYKTLLPADRTSAIAKAVLPGEVGQGERFGAFYKKLQFHELWDNMWRVHDHADIVVKFDDKPTSVIYWRGTNYAANWVTDNNHWMADQSSEIFTKHGCSEHMADKQNRHSYARIIENTPARVVIHWRYPCVDVSYFCANRRNWSDEYHTIYPDGTGIRKVIWNKQYDQPGFQDIQFFTNPGETALDVVDIQAMTVANVDGQVKKLKWDKPNVIPGNTISDACIELLNSKSKYKVYALYQGGNINPWGGNEQSQYTDDPFAGPWNHWPVHFVPSDGRFAVAHDRVTHFALGANDSAPEYGGIVQYGFTDQDITSLIPQAKAWRNPPRVNNTKNVTSQGYDKDQKAFVFSRTGENVSFSINASKDSPVVNPCFVVKKWNSSKNVRLFLDGKEQKPGPGFRQGIVHDTDGQQMLVVWLAVSSDKTMQFSLQE